MAKKKQAIKKVNKTGKKMTGTNQQGTQFSDARESLMPELEELVKKNPNRLIGCGG